MIDAVHLAGARLFVVLELDAEDVHVHAAAVFVRLRPLLLVGCLVAHPLLMRRRSSLVHMSTCCFDLTLLLP